MNRIATSWFQRSLIIAALSTMVGCASLRNGGTPESLPTRGEDRASVDKVLQDAGKLEKLFESGLDATKRNQFIRARFIAIDSRFYDFVTSLRVERQATDAGVQLAQIALGVAGVATAATRTKTNLAAAAATLAGVKAVVDKEYYFDKSVPGLVAIMNAKRLGVLTSIRRSMIDGTDVYGPQDVIADLDRYERMGQLAEAVAAVEVYAKEEEKQNLADIRTIEPVTDAQVDVKRGVNDSISKLAQADAAGKNRVKLDAVVLALGGKSDRNRSYKETFDAAYDALRRATVKQIEAAAAEFDKP